MSNFDKCREVLQKIAAWNGAKNYEAPEFEANYELIADMEEKEDDKMASVMGFVESPTSNGAH